MDRGALVLPANALNTLSNQLARLVGPAPGGVAVAALGLPAVVIADAASLLVAAALVTLVPHGTGAPDREPFRM